MPSRIHDEAQPNRGGEGAPRSPPALSGLEMGRHRTSYYPIPALRPPGELDSPLMDDRSRLIEPQPGCFDLETYSAQVGGRIRRLRKADGLTQNQLVQAVRHPRGHRYSVGFLSRIERGFANPPLHAYILLAQALAIDTGTLMGPEPAADEPSQDELLLLAALRGAGLAPAEALARLVGEP